MLVSKKKGVKFNQKSYDIFFNKIEYNLRELGFGDVTVNKKMKELNKILYDILLKIDLKKENNNSFKLNQALILNYFDILKSNKDSKYSEFEGYFLNFFNFCFELPLNSMIKEVKKFKY